MAAGTCVPIRHVGAPLRAYDHWEEVLALIFRRWRLPHGWQLTVVVAGLVETNLQAGARLFGSMMMTFNQRASIATVRVTAAANAIPLAQLMFPLPRFIPHRTGPGSVQGLLDGPKLSITSAFRVQLAPHAN